MNHMQRVSLIFLFTSSVAFAFPYTKVPSFPQYTRFFSSKGIGCGILANDTLSCFGEEEGLALTPPSDLGKVISVFGVWNRACVIRSDLHARCFGSGVSVSEAEWVKSIGKVTAIFFGPQMICVIDINGYLRCEIYGEEIPLRSMPPYFVRSVVFQGDYEICFIRDDDDLLECPDTSPAHAAWLRSLGPVDSVVTHIDNYSYYMEKLLCAKKRDNSVACWRTVLGANQYHYWEVSDFGGPVQAIGIFHDGTLCALLSDHRIRCRSWANNQSMYWHALLSVLAIGPAGSWVVLADGKPTRLDFAD